LRGDVKATCKCLLCNKTTEKHLSNVLRGATTSCGCRKDQYKTGKQNKCFKGYEELSGKFLTTRKARAERKGLEFNISLQYIWELFLKQQRKCSLSGLDLYFGDHPNASLDRIDSLKGYTNDNVQWVHKDVNVMKNLHEQEYFILLCHKVAQFNKLKKDYKNDSEIFKRGRYVTYQNSSNNQSHSK
jgi:hypothetical protein